MNPQIDRIYQGDVLYVLRFWPDGFVDAVVTDPPYGIRFMGQAWDGKDIQNGVVKRMKYHGDESEKEGVRGGHKSRAAYAGKYDLSNSANLDFQEWTRSWAAEAFRVMKPGAHLVSFASTRTYHRMASGIEDAGFEIRDQIGWIFGSGFPKSKNLKDDWKGWGTALKPGWEPIVLARKPLDGTVEENVRKWGTGALNIDGCRIQTNERLSFGSREIGDGIKYSKMPKRRQTPGEQNEKGRWPSNVAHDGSDEVLNAFPDAPGQQGYTGPEFGSKKTANCFGDFGPVNAANPRGDIGSAARFFYCAKASRADREEHLDGMPNHHPTVKPTNLMRWLCRLVTRPGGLLLDPFFGSGSTGKAAIREGFHWIGIEKEVEYIRIAERRIAGEISQIKMF